MGNLNNRDREDQSISNFSAARAFVEFGLKEREAGRRESASGPGSAAFAAAECLKLLDASVAEYGVNSILDLGCGDWNWMRSAGWRQFESVEYDGWDAHEGLIVDLRKAFGGERTRFRVADITSAELPGADLVVCRDVLFHLPLALASKVIRDICALKCLLLSTSFLDIRENKDIETYLPIEGWGFHRVNLDIPPFNLQDFRVRSCREPECASGGIDRSVCLYDLRN
jgi:SAM-dependent methyltransferase